MAKAGARLEEFSVLDSNLLCSTLLSFAPFYPTVVYYPLRHSTLLSFTLFYPTSLHSTPLHYTLLSFTLFCSTIVHYPLRYSTLPSLTLFYSTLLCSALLYSPLPYATLPSFALFYSTLLHSTHVSRTGAYIFTDSRGRDATAQPAAVTDVFPSAKRSTSDSSLLLVALKDTES